MEESVLDITGYDPAILYGAGNANIERVKALFPKLKIIERGAYIKVLGSEQERNEFEQFVFMLLMHVDNAGSLSIKDVDYVYSTFSGTSSEKASSSCNNADDDIILKGRNGRDIKARTRNQQRMVRSIADHDLLFAIGPAGSGKTFTAVALAVKALKDKEVRRIVLTRPAVEAGENLGFLPGDLKEKLDPYMRPLYDALSTMLPLQKLQGYLEDGTIEIAPLAFMRGRTLNNAFAILDEAQNATDKQLKMFLTRMGEFSKFIITGDVTQIDLPNKNTSGLLHVNKILNKINGIDFIYLNEKDIIRHKLVNDIVMAYDEYDSLNETKKSKNI